MACQSNLVVASETWIRLIFGLIVALGLLIDNAIVVVDEVRSSIWHGTSPSEAIRKTLATLLVAQCAIIP